MSDLMLYGVLTMPFELAMGSELSQRQFYDRVQELIKRESEPLKMNWIKTSERLFHFHDWMKWTDPVSSGNSGHKQQWRVCAVCNKAQFRTLLWDEQTSIGQIVSALKLVRAELPPLPEEQE